MCAMVLIAQHTVRRPLATLGCGQRSWSSFVCGWLLICAANLWAGGDNSTPAQLQGSVERVAGTPSAKTSALPEQAGKASAADRQTEPRSDIAPATTTDELAHVSVTDAWIRWIPPVSTTSTAYFVLHNESEATIAVTGARSNRFGAIEIHTTEPVNGMKKMRRLREVTVQAGEMLAFAPGGKHLMLFRTQPPLQVGEMIALELEIDGSWLAFTAEVRQ